MGGSPDEITRSLGKLLYLPPPLQLTQLSAPSGSGCGRPLRISSALRAWLHVPITVMCALKSPSPMRMERTSVRLRSIIWVAKCSSAPYRCRGRAAPVAVGRRKCGDAARVKGGIEVESPARSFLVDDAL